MRFAAILFTFCPVFIAKSDKMAVTDFLHGVEVIEVDDGSRPVRTVRLAVITYRNNRMHFYRPGLNNSTSSADMPCPGRQLESAQANRLAP